MDNTYYVVSNGTHVTVIKDSDILIADVDDNSQSELHQAALARATAKFETAGMETANLTIVGEVDGDTHIDDMSDYGVPQQAVLDHLGERFLSDSDPDIDDDAVVSGLSAQCWAYVDTEALFEGLAVGGPVPVKRSSPDREERLRQQLKSKVAPLTNALAAELVASGCANAARMATFQKDLEAIFDGEAQHIEQAPSVCASVRSWEVAEGSARDLTEQQQKPWDLSFTMRGNQGELVMKPAGVPDDEALEGLRVLVEINKGFPALHISPTPAGDVGVIVHSISRHELEVAPNSPHLGTAGASKIYNTPAIVYSNDDTGEDPRGYKAA